MKQNIIGLRTKVYSVQKAWDLVWALRKAGAEGVQNDSLRYTDDHITCAFKDDDFCWIGYCGKDALYGQIRIISNHDTIGKKCLIDVSESKFIEKLGLEVTKTDLPKKLKIFNEKWLPYYRKTRKRS